MFVSKIYKEWRSFFWMVITFLVGQFYFVAKGIETIPFFLYHMFSAPHPASDTVVVMLVKTPNGYLNLSKSGGRAVEMLMNNTALYNERLYTGSTDPLTSTVNNRFRDRVGSNTFQYLEHSLLNHRDDFAAYPEWWKRYYEQVHRWSSDSVSLVSSKVYFKPFFHQSDIDSIVFTVYQK